MALKYFVVRQGSKSEYVFLISDAQEIRLRTAIKDARPPVTITATKSISAEDVVPELMQVIKNSSVLIISSQVLSMSLSQIATIACEAHLRGVRMIGFEAALSELNVQVGTDPSQLVKTFMHSAAHQTFWVRMYSTVKHVFEPILAALMLIMLSPVMAVVALAIKFTSPGPVLYRQTRVGYRGRTFEILKFRSMRTDAEKDGPVWASAKTGDSRLSPIGGFLRASHLDELPQLWNVVRGDLSFVGPRPERPIFTDQLVKDIPLFGLRTLVKPGITGWAQVCQGYANSVDDSRVKLELDFYYILKHSPVLDAKVVLRTLGVISSGGTEGKKRDRAAAAQTVAAAGLKTELTTSRRRGFFKLPLRRSNGALRAESRIRAEQ